MKALRLRSPAPVTDNPLRIEDVAIPVAGPGEILIRVKACGICHTDLHIVEGDLVLPKLPITPGHQVVGRVEQMGAGVQFCHVGDRVGVPWLNTTCGRCEYCLAGKENLCVEGRFTGFHVDGGFAEHLCVAAEAAYPLPSGFSDISVAPLLCAGVIGYRALRMSGITRGERLGLFGFGASAHIALQVARYLGCEVYVFTRGDHHRRLAEELGAAWTGTANERPPRPLQAAVIFAPAGELVPSALEKTGRGGIVALAGIHMSPIPSMEYSLLYQEKGIRSVANSTREDVRELLAVAAEIPLRTEVETFPWMDANRALARLKKGEIRGSGVLDMS
jgi:propanol-preferring alcohol dehydrogenase